MFIKNRFILGPKTFIYTFLLNIMNPISSTITYYWLGVGERSSASNQHHQPITCNSKEIIQDQGRKKPESVLKGE